MSSDLAFVALGSNLGNSREVLLQAAKRLEPFSESPVRLSRIIQTEPVDCPPGSPPFLNAVAGLQPHPGETPESLLEKLQQIETELGRRRTGVRNEARAIDLDLIAFGQQSRSTSQLMLPHPRAHLRRFVLEPLAEIAPDFILPGQRETISELLAKAD
jgi:2-amino-4-hydroxy-6-hydroxymethyldihydropteridine diphosphokinase